MLTLTEQLNYNYTKSYDYFNVGIEIIDLSPDEINDAISEMEMRLNGTWEETENDKKRQKHFWEIFKSNKIYKKLNGTIHPETRIGSSFLKNNPEFLN